MVWLTPEITPQAVRERGWANWEAVVTDWGLYFVTSELPVSTAAQSLPTPVVIDVFPLTIPSVAAVAVGPQSTADRFNVTFNMNLDLDSTVVGAGVASPIIQPCSVGQPVTIPLGGPVVINADPNQQYLSSLKLPENIWRGPRFIADDGSQTVTFFDFVSEETTTLGTVAPKMHVLCYLQPPAAGLVQKRYPLRMGFIYPGGAIVAPTYERGWPIMGRRRVRVTISNTAAPASSSAVLRFGIVAAGEQVYDPTGLKSIFPQEVTVQTITVAANAAGSFTLEGAALANAYFLTMWINSVGNTIFSVSVEAYDD